ncbi:MAG TPA: pyridoxamine 5'-phosphate oxidase family protein [Candidatus Acidoferrales bacterium]|nr:pyridoxamine 5'-phosphate oxidase family protein [Candidatus Acidoferrales bacterium]
MLIREIAGQDSLKRLAHMRLGRLACAQGAQPYVAPFYFVYDSDYLYSFSTVGQRINWMRANPLVCVETDEVVSLEEWVSIIIFGRYEELPNTPEWETARERAHQLLQKRPTWWEPAYAKTIVQGAERPLVPVYFRIYIDQITGHQASPGPA